MNVKRVHDTVQRLQDELAPFDPGMTVLVAPALVEEMARQIDAMSLTPTGNYLKVVRLGNVWFRQEDKPT